MENRPGSKAFEQARQALLEAASGPRGAIPSGVAVPVGPDVDCQVLCAVMGSNPPGVAPNTQAAYRSALSKLNEWLEGKPLNDESLADYLVFLFLEKKSPAVAAQAISACTASAQLAGQWRPSGPRTAAILAGYRKSAGNRGTGRVQPLQWPQLERCVSLAADGSPRGLRDAALLLVMWDAMLDASQIRAVDMEDLEFLPDGTAALRVVVREGMAERRRLQQQTVLRLQNWRYCFPARRAGPLFCRLDKSGRPHTRLTRQGIQLIVQTRARDAQVSGRISSRSVRMGAAQMLAQLRVPQIPGQVLPETQPTGQSLPQTPPGDWREQALPAGRKYS